MSCNNNHNKKREQLHLKQTTSNNKNDLEQKHTRVNARKTSEHLTYLYNGNANKLKYI